MIICKKCEIQAVYYPSETYEAYECGVGDVTKYSKSYYRCPVCQSCSTYYSEKFVELGPTTLDLIKGYTKQISELTNEVSVLKKKLKEQEKILGTKQEVKYLRKYTRKLK